MFPIDIVRILYWQVTYPLLICYQGAKFRLFFLSIL